MRCLLNKLLSFLIVVMVVLLSISTVSAQDTTEEGPVYIVQAGDNLWGIAQRFGVSIDDLISANGISNAGNINIGQRLVIPGLEGVSGVLATLEVPYGETIASIAGRYGIEEDALVRLNQIVSPYQVYAGENLVIPQQEEDSAVLPGERVSLELGKSLFEQSIRAGENYWAYVDRLGGEAWSVLPGEVKFVPGEDTGPGALPDFISGMKVDSFPFVQGKTTIFRIATSEVEPIVSGQLMGSEFHFFPSTDGDLVALLGVHAMTTPGLYDLGLTIETGKGETYEYHQMVQIASGGYPLQTPITVPPATLDPEVTEPEDIQWKSASTPATQEKYWDGRFHLPSSLPETYCLETGDCWTSFFGNRRSYNGSPYNYFHSGLDIAGKVGDDILAPANGVVVFTGELAVRGNATIIDHGWGVYTGYMHQTEILVAPGDRVETGQLIGYVGNTGRSAGPHLHWEVILNGIQVDPMDWLYEEYP